MYTVLELAGPTLIEYYHKMIRQMVVDRMDRTSHVHYREQPALLTNILKGAAIALRQFHKRE